MKLTIIGASGHGKVVADIAKRCGYDEIEFLDDDTSITTCSGYPVVGTTSVCANIKNDIFVGIGDARTRRMLIERYFDKKIPVLVHPDAVIADDVDIGKGSVIMAGVVVNPGTVIGIGTIVNTSSSIDHDCVIGNYVHVAVGAHLAGTVNIGDDTWIGAGSIVTNNIKICGGCTIGAGTVVVKHIEKIGTYIGVPAKMMEKS